MKRSITAAIVATVVAALSPSLYGQWPLNPSAGIPKGPDGQPNLTAPAPRTSDGKPDLSGIWLNGRGGGRGRGQGNPPNQQPPDPAAADRPPLANFGNAGAGFKEGLPFQPWAAELQKKRQSEQSRDNPDALCLPMGLLQFHLQPQPRKIVQTPTQILIIYEANYGLRTIYTDGRTLPPQGEPQPYWYGYSAGRWEGDTLVVDSNNFRDDGWLDVRGSPTTDAAKVTERFRRPNFGQLDIEFTLDDPKAYTKPWTVRIEQRLQTDGSEPIEFICHENQYFLKLTGRAPR